MSAPSVDDFAGYTMPELVKLCNENGVKGHSKKKVHEIVDLLIRAGVHPVKKEGSKKGRPAKEAAPALPAAVNTTNTTDTTDADETASTSSTSSHEYIFRASWRDVLQHLQDGSAQLVIADPVTNADGVQWIAESLRVLEEHGTLVVRGLHPQAVPESLQNSQWIPVGTETLLIVTKSSSSRSEYITSSVTAFYESLISNTRSDATILVPFAGDGTVCKLVHKHRRSFVTMDNDEERVARLYKIVH